MALDEAGEIFACWERDPPAHLIMQTIARMLGWSPAPHPLRQPRIADIATSAPPGLTVAQGGAIGMPAPVFDLDALRARNRTRAAEVWRRSHAGGEQELSRVLGGA